MVCAVSIHTDLEFV